MEPNNNIVSDLSRVTTKASLPPELEKKFNWGAFFLNWVWGVFHKYYWPLIIVPGIGFLQILLLFGVQVEQSWIIRLFILVCLVLPFLAYIIYLGRKGSKIAWERREWRDVDHFKSVQKKWTIAGIIIGIPVVYCYLFISYFFAVILQE